MFLIFTKRERNMVIMVNPASLMKIMNAKNTFTKNHPKFAAFLGVVFAKPIEEGTVIEFTVTRPGEAAVTSNLKVQESDLELFSELKSLVK